MFAQSTLAAQPGWAPGRVLPRPGPGWGGEIDGPKRVGSDAPGYDLLAGAITRRIWFRVKFCPPTDSRGGFWVRSTESTTPVTWVGTAVVFPVAGSVGVTVKVELPSGHCWPVLPLPVPTNSWAPGCTVPGCGK